MQVVVDDSLDGRRAGSASARDSWARGVWLTRRVRRPAPPPSVPCSHPVCLGCDVVQCHSRRALRPPLRIANGIATATRLRAHTASRTNTPDPNRWLACRRACFTHAVGTQRSQRRLLSARIHTAPANRTLGSGRRHPLRSVPWCAVARSWVSGACWRPWRAGPRRRIDVWGRAWLKLKRSTGVS